MSLNKKCEFNHCQSISNKLFQAPTNYDQLLKWKRLLGTAKNDFSLCEIHFENKFVEYEKVLKKNAIPTLQMNESEKIQETFCECCYAPIYKDDRRLYIESVHQEIYKLIFNNFDLNYGFICSRCNDQLTNIYHFKARVEERQKDFLKNYEVKNSQNEDLIKSEYFCDYCSKKFETKIEISQHFHDHKIQNEETLYCDECNKKFKSKKELVSHFKKCHSKLICESVKKEKSLKQTQKSKEIHVNCPKCAKVLKQSSLSQHIKIVHEITERIHTCQICSKRFKTKNDLNRHLMSHSGEARFCCESCGKCYTNKTRLKKHRETRHTENRIKFECEFCDKKLLSRLKLKCHLENFHKNGESDIRINPETNCYHCENCGKKFETLYMYQRHKKLKTTCGQDDQTQQLFTCPQCDKILKSSGILKKHIKHVHTSETVSCKICAKKLKNAQTLWQHMTLSHQSLSTRKIFKFNKNSKNVKITE